MPHPLLDKLLRKAGLKDVTELREDEKATYDQLVKDLREKAKPITPQDWTKFLEMELEKTILSFDPDNSDKKRDFLSTQTLLIQRLLVYLKGPEREEEQIKKEYNI